MEYYVVDAFTEQPGGGNAAGVVLLGEGRFPDAQIMQEIAAELRFSETAFVQQNAPCEFSTRYFTPVGEVDICGHATIAAFGLMLQLGILFQGEKCLNHTLAGDLQIVAGNPVMMQMAIPRRIVTLNDKHLLKRIGDIFGIIPEQIPYSPEIISAGLPDIILPLCNLETLQSLQPDMAALSQLSEELHVVGVHAFAMDESDYTAHVRNFAPRYGIDEESATGTSNAALTYYLWQHHLITIPFECHFIQGEAMGKPSIITTVLTEKDRYCKVVVGGRCYIREKKRWHYTKH